ncbi:MAG: response regulator [Tepidisphaeraceae bacterium]
MQNSKPNILLVEDDPAIGAAVCKFLQVSSFAPVLCGTAAEAFAAIESITPDAVVTDVHLPDINGLVLTQKLRERFGPDLPIIVLSGDTSTEVLKSLTHVGATYFLNKPVNLEVLREKLSDYLQPTP